MGCCGKKANTDNDPKVLEVLRGSDEPLKAGEIAERIGLEKDDVSKIITRLKKSGEVISPKRCFYSAS